MGGICCKGTSSADTSLEEKQQRQAEQGTSSASTEAAVRAPGNAGKHVEADLVQPDRPRTKDGGPQGPGFDSPITGPAPSAGPVPIESAVAPEQIIICEPVQRSMPAVQQTAGSLADSAPVQASAGKRDGEASVPSTSAASAAADVPQLAPDRPPETQAQPVVPAPAPVIATAAPTSASAADSVAQLETSKPHITVDPGVTAETQRCTPTAVEVAADGTVTPLGASVFEMQQVLGSHAGQSPFNADQPRVKVETIRKNTNGPGTGCEGASSVSYSHSAASSQQPGSSAAAGSTGHAMSAMMGSSAAANLSATGETAPTTTGNNLPGAESMEGSGVPVTDSATPGPKQAGATFMFGAPRVKERKEQKERKRRDPKRTKSHSSSSTQSGTAAPTGSDTVTGSKTSAAASSDVTGKTPTATMGSSAAVPGVGSSAAAPSASSIDMAGSSIANRSIGGVGSSAGIGLFGAGGGGSTVGSNAEYKSIGRRMKTVKGSTDGSSGKTSAGKTSAAPGGDATASGLEEGVPEVVPEEEAEGEATDHSGTSERSSSEHLSIMSPPEGSDVENVLQLICNIFQLPVALVAAYRSANIFIRSTALRLTDDDQWRYSLAQWSMLNVHDLKDVLLVPDASKDERFCNYYCVKNEPKLKLFMASPLRSSTGELLGTLCMADFVERNLEPHSLLVVNNLQTLVIKQLEKDIALAQERVENEEATEKLQQEMMRALDHFEKCIMFVDTSKPGWEVLYTNMAWEHVTGIPREHVMGRLSLDRTAADASRVPRVHVMGRPLQDFFMALGGAALDWSSTAAEVSARSEFTVHRVAVRQKPDKLVSLHLRLATNEASGELEGLLPKGLPTWVKARGNEAHNYFVFVEEVVPQVGGGSTVYEALAKHVEKVPGLELSHLLGKGGFGSVYYGTWNGMPVAVKMIDNRLTKTNTEGVSLEALMGQELSHPNIVKTIKYVMRSARGASSMSGSNSRGGMNSSARGAAMHSRHSQGPMVSSQHGSRNIALAGTSDSHGPGSSGVGNGNGGMMQTSNTQGLAPYMTSAQPGLSGMTSAQMAAALDLTSASGMQHMHRMGTTMGSDATTIAGGGSSFSGAVGPMDQSHGSGLPPRVANLVGSTPPTPHVGRALTNATTSTTNSGLTAVGPASVHASSASTAAGPPSMASGGGIPANVTPSTDLSKSGSGLNLAAQAAGPAHRGPAAQGSGQTSGQVPTAVPPTQVPESAESPAAAVVCSPAGGDVSMGSRLGKSTVGGVSFCLGPEAGGEGSGRPVAPVPLPATLPALAVAACAPAAAPSITPPCPPGTTVPNAAMLTAKQQTSMTSRFSMAFSTITSGGNVLVPGKGSRSPSSSSAGGQTQAPPMGSAGSGEDMGEVWIIMEFCDRGSLQDALDRGALKLRKPSGEIGETHLPMMVATACEVASALQYLHGKGIVHGDLTAWNVMLCTAQNGQDRSGRNFVAKVADFGLSRSLDLRSKIKTRTYGTISHMPPECLINGIISKATDVFAFGVLLWQMYTGLRPWAGMNHGQIIYNVGMKNVQLIFPPGTPPAISDLSSSCTRTEPTHRPSFNEIMDKLDKIRASLGL